MSRGAYLLNRLFGTLFVVFLVSTLVFFVVRWVPGDPVESILGEHASEADRRVLRDCLGLDLGLVQQYGRFLGDIADGSLGHFCDDPGVTVRDRLLEAVPFTLELALTAVLISLLIALPLGTWAALRAGSWVDVTALVGALVGISVPSFWLGPMLLLAFTVVLRVFPDPGSGVAGLSTLVLPALTLGGALAAKLTRMTRTSLLEVLHADFVRTARAKGLPERVVVAKHAFRNAMLPLVTVVGLQLGALLSGAIIVEKVFARPGLGTLLMDGVEQRNFMLVQGCVLVIAFTYALVNLVTDLTYALVDPRIRLEEP